MKHKKIVTALSSLAIVAVMATTAFAAPAIKSVNLSGKANTTQAKFKGNFGGFNFNNLTDEQKAQFETTNADGKKIFKINLDNLTDEQKAEIEARRTEMEANRAEMEAKRQASIDKWNSLTDAQKEEIYSITDKSLDNRLQVIDKYVELGILSSEDAAQMKKDIETAKADIRANGNMPGLGMGHGMGKGMGMGKDCPMFNQNVTPSQPTQSSTAL